MINLLKRIWAHRIGIELEIKVGAIFFHGVPILPLLNITPKIRTKIEPDEKSGFKIDRWAE